MKQTFDIPFKIGQTVYYRRGNQEIRTVVVRGLEFRYAPSGKITHEFHVSPPDYPEFTRTIYSFCKEEKIAAFKEALDTEIINGWMEEED